LQKRNATAAVIGAGDFIVLKLQRSSPQKASRFSLAGGAATS
jgi:hypothetical protein